MEGLMLLAIGVDTAAVAALLWLVRRSRREREESLALQRETLARLRADLAQLVSEAEARTRALDEGLARREERLRTLLAEAEGGAGVRRTADPAEARLLRQLRVSTAATGRELTRPHLSRRIAARRAAVSSSSTARSTSSSEPVSATP